MANQSISIFDTLYKHVVKLIINGILVIPVKGIGDTLQAAKHPIIPKGIRYKSYTSEIQRRMVLESSYKTLDLLRDRKITAFGVPGSFNYIIWIDIDAKKFPVRKFENVFKELAKKGAYVERTASGGIHIGIKARDDEQLNTVFVSQHGEVDTKTFGYVIAAPSILYARKTRTVYRYTKLPESRELYEPIAHLDEIIDALTTVVEPRTPDMIEERIETAPREKHAITVPLLSKVPAEPKEIIKALIAVYRILGCNGMERFLIELYRGRWALPYVDYQRLCPLAKHPRSSWGIIEYNLGSVMAILGMHRHHVESLGEYIEKLQEAVCTVINGERVCGDPANTPATDTMLQGFRYRNWGLDLRGHCALRLLGLCSVEFCDHNTVTIVLAGLDILTRRLLFSM